MNYCAGSNFFLLRRPRFSHCQTQFPGRFKKDGVETLNEALVEYMAEIEDAILDLDAEKEGETADSSTEDAPLELV